MNGPCLCGDPGCPSCGTAQGTYPDHRTDADCRPHLDPETLECQVCGVVASEDPCPDCGHQSFHRPNCPAIWPRPDGSPALSPEELERGAVPVGDQPPARVTVSRLMIHGLTLALASMEKRAPLTGQAPRSIVDQWAMVTDLVRMMSEVAKENPGATEISIPRHWMDRLQDLTMSLMELHTKEIEDSLARIKKASAARFN